MFEGQFFVSGRLQGDGSAFFTVKKQNNYIKYQVNTNDKNMVIPYKEQRQLKDDLSLDMRFSENKALKFAYEKNNNIY